MQVTSGKPGLGAKTLDREVQQYLDWVAENLPNLSMRQPAEVRRVIVQALNDTRIARVAIGLVSAPIGIFFGFWVAGFLIGESSLSQWTAVGAVLGGAAVTYLTTFWTNTLVHRKIEAFSPNP